MFEFFKAPPSLIMVYCCVFLLAEALALEAVAVKTQLTDACFGRGVDNFRTYRKWANRSNMAEA